MTRKERAIPLVHGNVGGLKSSQLLRLERLYRRRIPVDILITPELARTATELSHEIQRQIGLLINRRGAVEMVIVGTNREVVLNDVWQFRLGRRFLRGLRLVHTHLKDEPLSQDDLTDLALLRLDLMAAIGVDAHGLPGHVYLAHLLPPNPQGQVSDVWKPCDFHAFECRCGEFIETLEAELARAQSGIDVKAGPEPAILVSASRHSRLEQEERLEELAELAKSHGVTVLDKVSQRPTEVHPKYLLGSGKLKDVVIRALQRGADLLIFDQDLTPAQARAIAELTELRVIDRTQLILDIFARRAHSREGKVQVELAQLRYLLPRLSGGETGLSRLGGGIGGRGPGETKLEVDRRRVRDRIAHLEQEMKAIARHRDQRLGRRRRNPLPVISIVGYTNAGKSTLLNALTHSRVSAEDRLFETLDTSSRRLRFPREQDAIITDTVGFIRDLPETLLGAFRTTLEELREADVLLHVVDASAKDPDAHIHAVQAILTDLHLDGIPQIMVLNKCDKISEDGRAALCRRFRAIGVSALHPDTLEPLVARLARTIEQVGQAVPQWPDSTAPRLYAQEIGPASHAEGAQPTS